MKNKHKAVFSLVSGLIGLMAAVQYQSIQQTSERDTRDMWEVRVQLQEEQRNQQRLYQEIAEAEDVINQYKSQSSLENQATLKDSLTLLREQAGLTEVIEEGVRIEILPVLNEAEQLQLYPSLTPELLNRLLNELNIYGATDIAIANERMTNVSPIRYVNGEIYVNNHPLPDVPLEIKVLAKNPRRLMDYMEVSQAKRDFSIENLQLLISYEEELRLPKYEEVVLLDHLHVPDLDLEEKGEE